MHVIIRPNKGGFRLQLQENGKEVAIIDATSVSCYGDRLFVNHNGVQICDLLADGGIQSERIIWERLSDWGIEEAVAMKGDDEEYIPPGITPEEFQELTEEDPDRIDRMMFWRVRDE